MVIATDNHGAKSESRFTYFSTVDAPTDTFAKAAPGDGAMDIPTSPSLSWGLTLRGASYEYCYDSTINNSCDGSWTSVGPETSVRLSRLSGQTQYEWQVRAVTQDGLVYANDGSWWRLSTTNLYLAMLPILTK